MYPKIISFPDFSAMRTLNNNVPSNTNATFILSNKFFLINNYYPTLLGTWIAGLTYSPPPRSTWIFQSIPFYAVTCFCMAIINRRTPRSTICCISATLHNLIFLAIAVSYLSTAISIFSKWSFFCTVFGWIPSATSLVAVIIQISMITYTRFSFSVTYPNC